MRHFKISAKRAMQGSNTYHSVMVSEVVNGSYIEIGRREQEYGYGSQYLVSAADILKEAGIMPSEPHNLMYQVGRHSAKKCGFTYDDHVKDLDRYSELKF